MVFVTLRVRHITAIVVQAVIVGSARKQTRQSANYLILVKAIVFMRDMGVISQVLHHVLMWKALQVADVSHIQNMILANVQKDTECTLLERAVIVFAINMKKSMSCYQCRQLTMEQKVIGGFVLNRPTMLQM